MIDGKQSLLMFSVLSALPYQPFSAMMRRISRLKSPKGCRFLILSAMICKMSLLMAASTEWAIMRRRRHAHRICVSGHWEFTLNIIDGIGRFWILFSGIAVSRRCSDADYRGFEPALSDIKLLPMAV